MPSWIGHGRLITEYGALLTSKGVVVGSLSPNAVDDRIQRLGGRAFSDQAQAVAALVQGSSSGREEHVAVGLYVVQ
jgi:hypothetical protein